MFTGTIKYLNKNAKCQVLTVQSKDINYLTKWKSKIHHVCLQETQLINKDSTDQTSEELFYILHKWKQEAGRSGLLILNKAHFEDSPGKQSHYVLVKGIYSIMNTMLTINTQASNSWHSKSHKASTTGHGEMDRFR